MICITRRVATTSKPWQRRCSGGSKRNSLRGQTPHLAPPVVYEPSLSRYVDTLLCVAFFRGRLLLAGQHWPRFSRLVLCSPLPQHDAGRARRRGRACSSQTPTSGHTLRVALRATDAPLRSAPRSRVSHATTTRASCWRPALVRQRREQLGLGGVGLGHWVSRLPVVPTY